LRVMESWRDITRMDIKGSELAIPLSAIKEVGCNISVDLFLASEIVAGTGLGSSASVCVGVLRALATYLDLPFSKHELAERSFHIARNILGKPVGKQDEYAAAFGGLNLYQFHKDELTIRPAQMATECRDALDRSLCLVYTGIQRHASATLHEQLAKLLDGKGLVAAIDGNPNAANLQQRAAGFRNTVTALAGLPYVVGADWFQYSDEPAHGRDDGEDYNFGLVDVHDQPYKLLTGMAQKLDLMAIKKEHHPVRPDASLGVPPAPTDPLGHFTIRVALKDWDRERGFVKPVSEFPIADLYVCWNKDAIYLGLYAQDFAEADYYRNKVIPEIDRAEWIASVAGGKPIHVRLGPGGPPACDEPSARVVNLSGVYMNTRNIAAIELPAKLFGKTRFRRGDSIEFGSTFFTQGRGERVEWKGKFTLGN